VAEIADEVLMAYADGALDPITRTTVEAALEKHPHYREKVEKFRSTRNPIRAAFQEELRPSHLKPLIDRIRRDTLHPVTTAAHTNARRVVRISNAKARTPAFSFRPHLPTAIAASVALLIGATLGWLLHSRPVVPSQGSPGLVRFSDGNLLAQGPLKALLEGASSGAPVMGKTEDGETWRLATTFTFRSASRSPCRRYEISSEAAGRFAGYACRSQEGKWFVHAHATVDPKVPNNIGFVPAAGGADAALEAAIRTAMDGDAYSSREEAELIASRWTTAGK
jgi:hypothetical protein